MDFPPRLIVDADREHHLRQAYHREATRQSKFNRSSIYKVIFLCSFSSECSRKNNVLKCESSIQAIAYTFLFFFPFVFFSFF